MAVGYVVAIVLAGVAAGFGIAVAVWSGLLIKWMIEETEK